MHNILRKLSSRKFWIALAGITTGVAMALGADGSDINAMTGAVTALISAVTYIIVEGKIDAESVKNTIEDVQTGIEVIEDAD
jgi:drug/metabolite transporter (DMT)-like permease